MNDNKNIVGQRWAWVAGASEGLGLAFANELAKRGYNILLFARREGILKTQAQAITQHYQVAVRTQALDLSNVSLAEQLKAWFEHCPPYLGIYNAAFAPVGNFLSLPLNTLNQVVDVNVRGPVVWAHTLGHVMQDHGGGLLFMSSLAGQQGSANIATYAASKAFNTILAEGLWRELNAYDINVLVCCAGAVRTPGYQQAVGKEAPGALEAKVVAAKALDQLSKPNVGPRIVPGWINRFGSLLIGRWLPRRWAVIIMSNVTKKLTPKEEH